MSAPIIETFVSPPLETNVYLVADPAARRALVVDPSLAGARLLERCASENWTLETIVLTHGHIDHIHDTAFLVRETGAQILTHEKTAPCLSDPILSGADWLEMALEPCSVSRLLRDGDEVAVGDCRLRALHTPGHSPGCICLAGDGVCFTGDLLFRDGVGRWDFPSGDQRLLIQSLRRLVSLLEDETVLYPGHGPETTLGREKRENPFLLDWL